MNTHVAKNNGGGSYSYRGYDIQKVVDKNFSHHTWWHIHREGAFVVKASSFKMAKFRIDENITYRRNTGE